MSPIPGPLSVVEEETQMLAHEELLRGENWTMPCRRGHGVNRERTATSYTF